MTIHQIYESATVLCTSMKINSLRGFGMYCMRLFALLCFLFAVTNGSAQSDLLNRFERAGGKEKVALANQFLADYIVAENISEQAVSFSATAHPDTLRQQVYYWAAEYFYDKQQWAEAEKYALKALPLCKGRTDRSLESDCLNLLSITYVRLTNYEKAAIYAKRCNEIDLETGDADKISSSYNTLAAIYMSARLPKDAEKYILKAIEYSHKADNLQRRAILYGMASEVYHSLKDEQKSYEYAKNAYEIEKMLGRADKAFIREAQMASALIGLKRFDEAKKLLKKVIPAFRRNGNRQSLGISCNHLGEIFLSEHQNDSAARYFDEALQIFILHKDLQNESLSRKGLYNALRESNPNLAMQHLERCNALKDSIYDSETSKLLSEYNAHYDNEQLQLDNERERAANRRNIIIAVFIVAIIALFTWFFIRRVRKKHRQHVEKLMVQIERLVQENQHEQEHPSEQANIREHQEQHEQPKLQQFETAQPEQQSETDVRFLAEVVKLVNEGLKECRLDVDTIASQLNMSTSTFRRRLYNTVGETPKTYISAIQMQKAAKLLQEYNDMSIADVAKACGFDEATNFSRAFKRFYGVTPSQFVKNKLS